jgi:hypothetical protein
MTSLDTSAYRRCLGATNTACGHIRCARPMLEKTTAQWVADYEKGCAQIMTSAKPG